jgi:hypothetical protein
LLRLLRKARGFGSALSKVKDSVEAAPMMRRAALLCGTDRHRRAPTPSRAIE